MDQQELNLDLATSKPVKIKKKREPKAPKPKSPNYHKKIIERFITLEYSIDKYFWPREMKFAGQLIKKYGADFLLWMQPPHGYKVTSLVFFLTGDGKTYLSEQLVEYTKQTTDLTKEKPQVSLSPTKIGEDIAVPVQQKPKTLKDFLKL